VMKVVRFGVAGTALAGAKSAAELLAEESVKLPIYTFCQELDDLLGGGVAVGEITELCGCPGIGRALHSLPFHLKLNLEPPPDATLTPTAPLAAAAAAAAALAAAPAARVAPAAHAAAPGPVAPAAGKVNH